VIKRISSSLHCPELNLQAQYLSNLPQVYDLWEVGV